MDEIRFEFKLELAQVVGLVGAALMLFGCFAPVINVPIVGGVSYVGNGNSVGLLVVACAVASAVLLLIRAYPWVFAPAIGATGLYTFTLWRFFSMQSEMATKLEGNPFAGLATKFAEAVSLGWGWFFLMLGVACLFASTAIAVAKRFPPAMPSSLPSPEPMFKQESADFRSASPFGSGEPRSTFGRRR